MFETHEAKIEVKFWAVGGWGQQMAVGVLAGSTEELMTFVSKFVWN